MRMDDALDRPLPDSFDDRCPAPPPRNRSWGVALSAALHSTAAAMVLIEIVPRFEQVFRKVKVPLPNLTLAVVSLSNLACLLPYGVYAAAVLLPLTLTRLDQRTAGRVKILSVILFMSLVGFIALGLFLPFTCVHCGIGQRHP